MVATECYSWQAYKTAHFANQVFLIDFTNCPFSSITLKLFMQNTCFLKVSIPPLICFLHLWQSQELFSQSVSCTSQVFNEDLTQSLNCSLDFCWGLFPLTSSPIFHLFGDPAALHSNKLSSLTQPVFVPRCLNIQDISCPQDLCVWGF